MLNSFKTQIILFSIVFTIGFSQHFNVDIAATGESTLFIFTNSISTLEAGDELGVFDMNGIVDDQGNTGEILVGSGSWTGSQIEVVAIGAVDLSDFGGPILPGSGGGNDMMLKVWDASENMEYSATYSIDSGSGTFNGLFTSISEVEYGVEMHFSLDIEETGESTLFIFDNSISALEIDDELALFDANGIVDDQGNTGEILVGTGTWTGSQLEVVAIQAVDLSDFGGPILPGAGSGNNMMLKVWDVSEEMEYDVTYSISSGSGTFNGLFTAIDEILFAPSYSIVINEYFVRANEDVPDYVELFNYGSDSIDLTGWDLIIDGDGELGSFDGYTIGAGEYLLLADGGDPFFDGDEEEYYAGEDIANSLNFDIGLGSGGDPIQLLDASGSEVDYIDCNDDLGWPTDRGNAGELSDPYSDNNDPSNWASSEADGTYMATEDGEYGEDFGTPGEVNSNYVITILGCMDPVACNFDAAATLDNGTCEYPDYNMGECDCAGTMFDCNDECGGDAFLDDCGQCVPGGTNPDDCLGVDSLPTEFKLAQNYPNPFNPVTTINFDVATPGNVELKIYDIIGNYVTTLVSGYYTQNTYSIRWDGMNQYGNDVSSGVYIYQLQYNQGIITKKMILIR